MARMLRCSKRSPVAPRPPAPSEAAAPPQDLPNQYVPEARPGARAPHIWLDGKSIFDLFGRDFTLLCFMPPSSTRALNDLPADALAWQEAAVTLGLPLKLLRCDNLAARTLYGAERVLIRPDHHVAWRGDVNANPEQLLAMACAIALDPERLDPAPGRPRAGRMKESMAPIGLQPPQ